jgi:hypothetical protein
MGGLKMKWVEVAKVPKLKQLCNFKYFPTLKQALNPPVKLGGSYAFATDEEGNIWFHELDPFGDDQRSLKLEIEKAED